VSEFIALFTRASKLMRSAADSAMSRHGVRVGQNLVIDQLAAEDGLTPGELAQRLGVTTPTIVKMAGRMESTGLVTKRRDSKDARLVRLHLTAHGRAVKAPVDEERRLLAERATAGLPRRDLQELEKSLRRMVANLEEIAPTPEDVADP